MSEEDLAKATENLVKHFASEVEVSAPTDEGTRKITILERMTELFTKNRGSLEISGWGIIDPADHNNPYLNYGINVNEAMELVAFGNMIYGYAMCIGTIDDKVWWQNNVWSKIEEIRQRDIKIAAENAKKAAAKYISELGDEEISPEQTSERIEKGDQDKQVEPDTVVDTKEEKEEKEEEK